MELKWVDEGEKKKFVEGRVHGTRPVEYVVSIIAGIAAEDPYVTTEDYGETPLEEVYRGDAETALESESAYAENDERRNECISELFDNLHLSVKEILSESWESNDAMELQEQTRNITGQVVKGNYVQSLRKLENSIDKELYLEEEGLEDLFLERLREIGTEKKRVVH